MATLTPRQQERVDRLTPRALEAGYTQSQIDSEITRRTGSKLEQSMAALEASGLLGNLEASETDYDAIVAAAERVAEQNLARLPRASDAAVDTTLSAASRLDEAMASRFRESIESILPNAEELVVGTQVDMLDEVRSITEQMLSGELPDDVRDEIMRNRAELGIDRGIFGEAAQYATARDLGLTSLDLVRQGVDYAVNAVSPLAQRVMSSVQQFVGPQTDIASLYGQNLSAAIGASVVPASQALQTSAGVAMANAQAQWASQLSQANLMLDAYQTVVTGSQNRAALQASQENTMISGGAQMIAAWIGRD